MDITKLQVAGVYYVTSDYSIFNNLPENRDVLTLRLNRLIRSFSIHEVKNPIIVNSEMQIIDGQGRYEAKKLLKLPIYFLIDEDATIEDCRRMNAYNTPWDSRDFIDSYASAGNENYIRLSDVIKETGLTCDVVMRLIYKSGYHADGSSRSAGVGRLKEGNLIFTEEDALNAKKSFSKAKEILEALGYSGRTNSAFWTGCAIIFANPKYDHKNFIKNCSKTRLRYSQMSKLEDQLKQFSTIANLGKRPESRVYFEDYMRNRGYSVRDYSEATGTHFNDKATKSMKTLGKE